MNNPLCATFIAFILSVALLQPQRAYALDDPEELTLDRLDLLEDTILEPQSKPRFQDQLFELELPRQWALKTRSESVFIFVPLDNRDATFTVRLEPIPLGTRAKHVWLRDRDQRYARYPRFSTQAPVLDLTMAGFPAARILGSYFFQGNQQYPRTVETTYIVRGNEVFILELDCFTAHASRLTRDVSSLYQTFVPRPSQSERRNKAPVDNVPY